MKLLIIGILFFLTGCSLHQNNIPVSLSDIHSAVKHEMIYTKSAPKWIINPKNEIGKRPGTCSNYMLLFKKRLLENGYNEDQLFYVLCTLPKWRPPNKKRVHAVLLVIENGNRWILDNRKKMVLKPEQTDYIWLKIKINGKWKKIRSL